MNPAHEPRSQQDIDSIVVFTRLELYNPGLACGPKAIRKKLDLDYRVRPLPSERTIARILARNHLTHGRTGSYEGDRPENSQQHCLLNR